MNPRKSAEHHREQARIHGHAHYLKNRERYIKKQRSRRFAFYGITEAEYETMVSEQSGLCRLCGGKPNGKGALHIDHDHSTGKVRGLLCHSCNTGLGSFKDNPELMALAIKYLKGNL